MPHPVLKYKLEDFDILNENYIEIEIKDGNTLIEKMRLEELSVAHFYEFVPLWQEYMYSLASLLVKCDVNLKLLDQLTNETFETLSGQLHSFFSYRVTRVKYIKILRKLGITKLSRRKFERYCKPSQLAAIFILLYWLNTDGVKKKFLSLVDDLPSISQRISEIFLTSFTSMGGSKKLTPRYRKSQS